MIAGADLPGPSSDAAVPSLGSSCPNCGSELVQRYCAECGQAAPAVSDYSFRAHASDFLEQITSVDGKIARTLRVLVTKPGLLTADHLNGRRSRYLRPLQLFLLVNVLLFVAAPRMPLFNYNLANYLRDAPPSATLVRALVARVAPTADQEAREEYRRAFDDRVEAQRKSLILLFVPALALILRLVFHRRAAAGPVAVRAPGRYGEHLVFAMHVLAFVWLVLIGWGAIAAVLAGKTLIGAWGWVVVGVLTLLIVAIPTYLFRAFRLAYSLSRLQAGAGTAIVVAAFVGLLAAYRALLFFTTYYTL